MVENDPPEKFDVVNVVVTSLVLAFPLPRIEPDPTRVWAASKARQVRDSPEPNPCAVKPKLDTREAFPEPWAATSSTSRSPVSMKLLATPITLALVFTVDAAPLLA